MHLTNCFASFPSLSVASRLGAVRGVQEEKLRLSKALLDLQLENNSLKESYV